MKHFVFVCCLLLTASVYGEDYNAHRALFNYQMSCQGCHTPDGTGANSVPRLKDHVGRFLLSQSGREYLVRVPGSATSALSDADLAEVLNWIVQEFSGSSAPDVYEPYLPQEVARLRQRPLNEVDHYRTQLLLEIASANLGE